MLNEIPKSVDRETLKAIYEKRVFERMTERTDAILKILKNEENDALYTEISKYVSSNSAGVYIEDLRTYLEAHVVDPDGQLVSAFGISTNPDDPTTESVQKETYELLREQSVIPQIIMAELVKQLEDAR